MRNILLHVTSYDQPYIPALKPLLIGKANVKLNGDNPVAVIEMVLKAKEKSCDCIATTSPTLLRLLAGKNVNLDTYSGSIFEKYGMEFLILPNLDQLFTVPYGKHLITRYFNKFIRAADWLSITNFTWTLYEPRKTKYLRTVFQEATFISVDIETGPEEERIITMLSLTAISINPYDKSYRCTTVVIPFNSAFNIAFAKGILATPIPKVFQNGKYDNSYFLRYGIIVHNWAFDTLTLFHSWYSELPKDLGFIVSYLLRKWEYHKDENVGDLQQQYEYNAKDSFTTALCLLALLLELPEWALKNFLAEFPVLFPCLLAEQTGIKQNEETRLKLREVFNERMDKRLHRLQKMLGGSPYNPNSPPQTQRLFQALGSGDITSTGKSKMDKVASRHPLNKLLITEIRSYRQERKATGNILKPCAWNGRIYFSLDPGGTDTGRNASRASSFWCGLQIQNVNRDVPTFKPKTMFEADDGYYYGEADFKQNETWFTAYLSGDPKLLEIVQDPSRDFHSFNSADFFGLPYTDLCSSVLGPDGEWTHKRLNIPLIDIAKRINHGANYNMGPGVLLETMGIENVVKAKTLLGLPAHWSLEKVCAYLLSKYAETYKIVKGPWYDKCIADVMGSHFLVGPTGWTRYCFGDPTKNKHHLNAYVAHPPQSAAAMVLNMAYKRVFREIAIPEAGNFKLGPQIHDSINFQYRKTRDDLPWKVAECMHNPIPVKDIFGQVRTLVVPVDLKGGGTNWSNVKALKREVSVKAA